VLEKFIDNRLSANARIGARLRINIGHHNPVRVVEALPLAAKCFRAE